MFIIGSLNIFNPLNNSLVKLLVISPLTLDLRNKSTRNLIWYYKCLNIFTERSLANFSKNNVRKKT